MLAYFTVYHSVTSFIEAIPDKLLVTLGMVVELAAPCAV